MIHRTYNEHLDAGLPLKRAPSIKAFAVNALVMSLIIALCGCGAVIIVGGTHLSTFSVSGLIIGVNCTTVIGFSGEAVTVTIVTFEQTAGATSLTFCGNVVPHFPMNNFITVNYTPAPICTTAFVIVLV